MNNKKNIIVIVIALVILILGVVLIYFGVNKKANIESNKETTDKEDKENEQVGELITKDTLFLCPSEENTYGNTGYIEIVKESDKKHESDVCKGYVGKYECPDGGCYRCHDYSDGESCDVLFANQSFGSYIDAKSGIATIYDTKSVDIAGHLFLYDFKNNKKLSSEMNFLVEPYRDSERRYFFVSQAEEGNYRTGIIDNYGNLIIPFGKYDSIGVCPGCSAGDGEGSIRDNGAVTVSKNGKYGFVDMKTGKELTKIEYDDYGIINEENNSDTNGTILFDEEMANRNLKLIYVVSNNEGKIINFTTGEVIRTLDRIYHFAFPLNQELVLVENNKTINILDKNNKSILKEKISYDDKDTVLFSWNNGNNYSYNNYDFKEFNIEIVKNSNQVKYIFDIENKELRKA